MKKAIYGIYKVLRSIVVAMLLLFVAFYSSLYILMSIPAVQQKIKQTGEQELSKLLGVSVSIRKISIDPLDEIALEGISIPDKEGRELISISKLGAGISLSQLMFERRIVIDYAEIIGLDAHLIKDAPDSPINLQFIIDAFKPKQKNKPPTKFDIEIDAVVIRKSAVSYDVMSEMHAGDGRFDKNHVAISRLSGDIRVPKLKNDTFEFDIKKLSLSEKSGFDLSELTAFIHIDKNHLNVENLKISMPNSIIIPEDIAVEYKSLKTMASDLKSAPLDLQIANSYISLSDLRAFVPEFKNLRIPIYVTCAISGTVDDLNISTVDISSEDSGFSLKTSGRITGLLHKKDLSVNAPTIKIYADTRKILGKMPQGSFNVSQKAFDIAEAAGYLSVNGSLKYDRHRIFYAGNMSTAYGTLQTNGTLSMGKDGKARKFKGRLKSKSLDVGKALRRGGMLNDIAFDIDADIALSESLPYGSVNGTVRNIDFKGYRYGNITANVDLDGKAYNGNIALHDPNADIAIDGLVKLDGENSIFDIGASIANLNPNKLNLTTKYPDHSIGAGVEISVTGNNLDNAQGDIVISDMEYVDADNKGIRISHFDVTSREKGDGKYMTINSDVLNGYIDGSVNFAHIVPAMKHILSAAFPSIFAADKPVGDIYTQNDFRYYLRIAENNEITSFFNLPLKIVHPIEISGIFDEQDRSFSLGIDAPYIMQGKKVLERNSLSLNIDGSNQLLSMNLVTKLDHKNGDITFIYNGSAANDRLDSDISWQYDRRHDFSGKVSLSSLLKLNPETKSLEADTDINPTSFMVNDTTWNIAASNVTYENKKISIHDINVYRENQFIKADGIVSSDYDDELCLQLKSIDLGYVFETLNINHVAFGGLATGDFYASGLLTSAPRLSTDNLNVKNFSYHNALLGEADINSSWDNENKGIVINADIHQRNSRESFVHGVVYPTRDSLAFKFNADRLNVEILKPFMAAFTSDVSGEASGEAELYGTFKFINMKGKLFADNFKIKIDYTNTYYTVSDSVIMTPGLITIPEAIVHDQYGNTAKLNGTVRHEYFKNAKFDFSITDARNILCYDTNEKMNPIWYGKVFASGSAYVKGIPGMVDLDLNMSSSPNSDFTFVLSDKEEAGEYSFITFTDKKKEKRIEEELRQKKIPEFLKKNEEEQQSGTPSVFRLNLQVDVNPGLAINLVMDPSGGDKIRGVGNGNLRIEYASNSDMKMFGNYTVEEGRYNFTLQDIIIREFSIKQGGTISFHGDPMNATVDLQAAYSLNANLQDLDESFAQDKDLNRTLVPVNALLNLSGVISQPSISFDLEFPTLTQDVYRKVRSIISTDDMMNQQIIYLLALSRFYTPEYMGSTSRNNELASVASSTISSQLTNILGQLSDKWSIAPNFHTDKGDFSDMEVELALSSRLLNNRLLFNGNFGYSDNAMNNNNFIGDFDIEYLLTKSGNFRLKAYNRYNDQNYYIRNSLTTQGVGIMFKHDFDRIFNRKKKEKSYYVCLH